MVLKSELHQLIDTCGNDLLLQEVKTILESDTAKYCWEELSEEDKQMLMESEVEYDRGGFITHAQLKDQMKEWKKK